MTKIGIIAGDGNLPLYIGKALLSKNYDITFLSLNNKNNKFYNNHHVVDLEILSVKKIFNNLDIATQTTILMKEYHKKAISHLDVIESDAKKPLYTFSELLLDRIS